MKKEAVLIEISLHITLVLRALKDCLYCGRPLCYKKKAARIVE